MKGQIELNIKQMKAVSHDRDLFELGRNSLNVVEFIEKTKLSIS